MTLNTSMKTLHIGIIGFGEMGKRHGREFMESSQGLVKVQAVVEIDDRKYEEGCQWCACRPTRYKHVGELLQTGGLDGVIISTPNFTHHDVLKQFAGLRMPILLEKPLDADFAKICEIVRFSRQYQGPMIVHHVMRYAPIVRKAKELILDGKIGRVCSVNFIQYSNGYMWHTFRRTMAGGGGMLVEKATHDLDVMLNLVGALPVRIAAVARQQAYGGDKPNDLYCHSCAERLKCPESRYAFHFNPGKLDVDPSDDLCAFAKEVDVPDNETCLIEFNNSVFGTYSHCYFVNHYFSREYEIIGHLGMLRISFTPLEQRSHYTGKLTLLPRYDTHGNRGEYDFDYYNKIHYNGGPGVVRHFVDLMNGAARPITTVEQAFAAEVAGYVSNVASRTGTFVNVDEVIPADLKSVWANIKVSDG